ncbi:hypothetical protein [Methanothrix soehngenii]|uniref:hypothetical protein n=1 Tax=Methanothrix soehngenii TaxID=2223 RepID=UPI002C6AC1DD|nr:hypothetical protein [Methanothrix soehngenii]HOS23147.1 hypothetical protein [Methanothrix soehngenii]HPL21457.1 hypothetical protein [Methanothrix soehngenii]
MAGSTSNIMWVNSSIGGPLVNVGGSGYPLGQIIPFEDIFGPKGSNQSDAYITNIMRDPREQPSLDELLDPRFFIKMPWSNKIRVEVKINSITQGTLKAPDFEEP